MTPIYGEKLEGQNYIVRPGVYGITFDANQRIALVKVPYGYHLPGGGIEQGEDELTCLKREFLEETGYSVEIGAQITICRQYTYSERSKNYYELVGHFYFTHINENRIAPIELDHELVWHTVDDAVKLLSLEYQVEAVKLAMRELEKGI